MTFVLSKLFLWSTQCIHEETCTPSWETSLQLARTFCWIFFIVMMRDLCISDQFCSDFAPIHPLGDASNQIKYFFNVQEQMNEYGYE